MNGSLGGEVEVDGTFIGGEARNMHKDRGQVHTNGLENFWSLLKRGTGGTYVSVEPFHLFRYVDEQAYRFNNRKATDAERFSDAVKSIVGKRVSSKQVTGKDASPDL